MIKRTLTGAIIVALVYAWLFLSHIPAVLHIGTLALGAFASFEILRICKADKQRSRYLILLIPTLLLVLPIPYYEYVMMLIFPVAPILFGVMMAKKERLGAFSAKAAAAVSVTVALLFKAIPTLRGLDNGFYYLTFAVTSCFVTDVTALLFGRAFGKKKLCPKISPKKTVAGAIGGILCTVIAALVAAVILPKYTDLHFNGAVLAIWALLTSVIGQLGDLCMSVVKRIAGVKDFGNLLPGHGGILDRFDSQLLAIPFTLTFCALTGGFIY